MSNSACLRADLENSTPSKKKFTAQSNTKASPFRSLRVHSKHEGTNMKCKPTCAPGGELPWRDTGGIHWRMLASRSRDTGELLWDTRRDTRRDPLARCSGGILGGIQLIWRDTRQDPLASSSGILSGIGGIRPLTSYSSGGILGGIHWDTQRDTRPGSTGQLL